LARKKFSQRRRDAKIAENIDKKEAVVEMLWKTQAGYYVIKIG